MSNTEEKNRTEKIQEAADKIFAGMSKSFDADRELSDSSNGIHRTICRFKGTEQLDLSLVYHYSNICDEAIPKLNHRPISNYTSQKQFVVTYRAQPISDENSFDVFSSDIRFENDLFWLGGHGEIHSLDGSTFHWQVKERSPTFLSVEPTNPIVDGWLAHIEGIEMTDSLRDIRRRTSVHRI